MLIEVNAVHAALQNISIDRLRSHIQALEGVRHPLADPAALEQAADYIHGWLYALGYAMSEHRFDEDGCEFRNIIATHRGERHAEERVIVMAHYDTESNTPGADDNASGVAALLELATVLRSLSFDRSIQFIAVTLEETKANDETRRFLRGSRALVRHAQEHAWNIIGAINLEMIAYAGDTVVQRLPEGLDVQGAEIGNFIAVIANQDSAELVEHFIAAVQQYHLTLPYMPLIVPGNGEGLPDIRRSDHVPFWDHGYKALMLNDTAEFRNPHYHQPSDTLATLNLPFAAEVCHATGGMVAMLARSQDGM